MMNQDKIERLIRREAGRAYWTGAIVGVLVDMGAGALFL
jgi:hypothetical protein